MRKIKMEEIKEKVEEWVERISFWLGYAYAVDFGYRKRIFRDQEAFEFLMKTLIEINDKHMTES